MRCFCLAVFTIFRADYFCFNWYFINDPKLQKKIMASQSGLKSNSKVRCITQNNVICFLTCL